MNRLTVSLPVLVLLAASAFAADLYEVRVNNEWEIGILNASGVMPVIRLPGGYLILAESRAADNLTAHGIMINKIFSNITRRELAIDLHHDRINLERFPLLYEEDDFRLFRIAPLLLSEALASASLMPISEGFGSFEYLMQQTEKSLITHRVDGLQELIDLVDQDSLTAYTERLQAFEGRVTGTDSNYAAAMWIAGKFTEFGYDSVVVDPFIGGSWECQNVMAFKIGARLPEHYIIVGAHYDAAEGSPGADDNGTGTAAVLEMARAVSNKDTDLTLVFILFDGEEQGLYGSFHYANEASDRGDSIIYMMNLDMIAHHENSDQANLFDGYDHTFSLLWQVLADSLVGIGGVLAGFSGGSDHFPFHINGYIVTFVHEYEHSDVLHSPRDSTTYLNFEYMTRMVQASLATVYWAAQSYIPPPSLAFSYPHDIPMALIPGQTTTFEVFVDTLYNGVPVPGTGKINCIVNDDSVQTAAMTIISENHYTAELPALNCGDSLRFYVSAEEETEGIIYDPDPSEPYRAFPVTGDTVVFFDDFESDRGWMVSGGLWERGAPNGGGGEYGGPDPVGGYNSVSVFGYNLSGDYTNNMPERSITCQPLDFSGLMGAKLSFYRWLGVGEPEYDHASVGVIHDAGTWTTVWENEGEVADGDWVFQEFDISSMADNQPVVYIWFTMGTTDEGMTYCGWNIDNITVTAFKCEEEPEPLEITTESLPDWTAGYAFAEQLIATGGVGFYTWTDKFGELSGTGLTLSSGGLISGMPESSGAISFTAEVTDQELTVAEKVFGFTVNDSLKIVTTELPSVIVNNAYSEQLSSSGGTGAVSWTDRDNDLSATGLSLATNGSLTGTPVSVGVLSFTARIEDGIGSSAESLLTIDVLLPYVCGDANGDLTVNVADGVFVINYVFKGGPTPDPYCPGDSNGDGDVNVADAVYDINYIFKGGPPPVENCCP